MNGNQACQVGRSIPPRTQFLRLSLLKVLEGLGNMPIISVKYLRFPFRTFDEFDDCVTKTAKPSFFFICPDDCLVYSGIRKNIPRQKVNRHIGIPQSRLPDPFVLADLPPKSIN